MKTTTSETSWFGGLKAFFFAEQSPYGLALVRMFLTSVALVPMIRRFPRVRELFSSDGAPQQLAPLQRTRHRRQGRLHAVDQQRHDANRVRNARQLQRRQHAVVEREPDAAASCAKHRISIVWSNTTACCPGNCCAQAGSTEKTECGTIT